MTLTEKKWFNFKEIQVLNPKDKGPTELKLETLNSE